MIVRIIGGHGGISPGFKATSYLIDGDLLIDAGSVAEGITISEQARIKNILISHAHLDHIKDLAFLCDNCFGMNENPFQVYSNSFVYSAIKEHLFNDKIWPDFSKLPNKENPTINFNVIEPEKTIQLMNYKITPVEVNHPGNAFGFIVEKDSSSVVFTQDTGPTDRIWELAASVKNLKAIFTEVSFPNKLKQVAIDSFHHTPETLSYEIPKMPADVPIFLGHLKPNFQELLYKEIGSIGCDRLNVLGSDDTSYVF